MIDIVKYYAVIRKCIVYALILLLLLSQALAKDQWGKDWRWI